MTPEDELRRAVALELGDDRGVVAGHIDANGRIAWIEAADGTFYLRTAGPGVPRLFREIETYNPYFGCDVSYLQWWGDEVVTIYREKHHTLCWVVPLAKPDDARIVSIDDRSVVDGDLVLFEGDEPGLIEAVSIPRLEPRSPLPYPGSTRWNQISLEGEILRLDVRSDTFEHIVETFRLRVPAPEQRRFAGPETLGIVERALTAPDPPPPAAGLLVGCVATPFWVPSCEPYASYNVGPRRTGESLHWLPAYWHEHLRRVGREEEARELVSFLEAVSASAKPAAGWDPDDSFEEGIVKLCTSHVRYRAALLARVCRTGLLPPAHFDYLFNELHGKPRMPDFTGRPRAVQAVWEQVSAAKPVSFSARLPRR